MAKQRRVIQRSPTTGRFTRSEVSTAVRAIHVAPREGTWLVHKAGPKRVSMTFPSRDEAVTYARSLVRDRPTSIVLHSRDGKITSQSQASPRSKQRKH